MIANRLNKTKLSDYVLSQIAVSVTNLKFDGMQHQSATQNVNNKTNNKKRRFVNTHHIALPPGLEDLDF